MVLNCDLLGGSSLTEVSGPWLSFAQRDVRWVKVARSRLCHKV